MIDLSVNRIIQKDIDEFSWNLILTIWREIAFEQEIGLVDCLEWSGSGCESGVSFHFALETDLKQFKSILNQWSAQCMVVAEVCTLW